MTRCDTLPGVPTPPRDLPLFETCALAELQAVRLLVEQERCTLVEIARHNAIEHPDAPGAMEEVLARIWMLGTIESALWRIEQRLTGGTAAE
jgi:hypothetical protein